jgi:hypothetical protein
MQFARQAASVRIDLAIAFRDELICSFDCSIEQADSVTRFELLALACASSSLLVEGISCAPMT